MYSAKKIVREGNVLFPKLPAWCGDVLQNNFVRLVANPTHAQIEVYRNNVRDFAENNFAVDLICLTFGAFLDALPPNLPPLTEEQHTKLYGEALIFCINFACDWFKEFKKRVETRIDL